MQNLLKNLISGLMLLMERPFRPEDLVEVGGIRGRITDFGSDALLFGLYVWVELKREVSWKVLASDLRYMIYKTLDEHGIVIAFP
jgi:small-conductance mechanosensitive channel